MKAELRPGSRNALVRRLQRHANLTALFRAPDRTAPPLTPTFSREAREVAAGARPRGPVFDAAEGPVVGSFLLPPEGPWQQEAPADLTTGAAAVEAAISAASAPTYLSQATTAPRQGSQKRAAPPRAEAQKKPAGALQKPHPQEPRAPRSAPRAGRSTQQPATAVQRAAEVPAAGGEKPPVTPHVPAGIAPRSALHAAPEGAPPVTVARPTPAVGATPLEPARHAEAPAPESSSSSIDDSTWRRLQTILEKHREKAETEAAAAVIAPEKEEARPSEPIVRPSAVQRRPAQVTEISATGKAAALPASAPRPKSAPAPQAESQESPVDIGVPTSGGAAPSRSRRSPAATRTPDLAEPAPPTVRGGSIGSPAAAELPAGGKEPASELTGGEKAHLVGAARGAEPRSGAQRTQRSTRRRAGGAMAGTQQPSGGEPVGVGVSGGEGEAVAGALLTGRAARRAAHKRLPKARASAGVQPIQREAQPGSSVRGTEPTAGAELHPAEPASRVAESVQRAPEEAPEGKLLDMPQAESSVVPGPAEDAAGPQGLGHAPEMPGRIEMSGSPRLPVWAGALPQAGGLQDSAQAGVPARRAGAAETVGAVQRSEGLPSAAEKGPAEGGGERLTEAEVITGPSAPLSTSPAQHTLPLEAVWPVQRAGAPGRVPPHGIPPSAYAPGLGSEHEREEAGGLRPPVPLHDETASQVEPVLRRAATGQPTDSGVEVLLPRRPRPVPLARSAGKPTAGATGEAPPAAEPSVQRQPESPGASPRPVETEIGPLPADLWRLLGVTPPAAGHAEAVGAGERVQVPTLPVSPEPAPHEQPVAPVQRAVAAGSGAEPGAGAAPAGPEAGAGAPSPTGEARTQVDVEDLARKVYGEIKRRLSAEWERSSLRF